MKKALLFALIGAIALGCNQGKTRVGLEDTRPESEKALIREINIADSTYQAQINEITKQETFEKSVKRISDFILKNSKAENWEAKIHKIDLNIVDDIEIDVMIAKGMQYEKEYPQYNSIVLKSIVSNNERLRNIIKTLQKDDEVLVSGSFSAEYKDSNGNLTLNSYAVDGGDDHDKISTPAFIFNLTDIKKK